MSSKHIPEHIDPFRLAEQKISLSGLLNVENMPRLRESIRESGSKVKVDMTFGMDEQGTTFVQGHLETNLMLICQRCMEPFVYEIITNFTLGIVNTLDEANALPRQYEPVIAKEGELAVLELIEDELILNLPIIPKHQPEECKVKLPLTDSSWDKEDKGENPFKVLESIKRN